MSSTEKGPRPDHRQDVTAENAAVDPWEALRASGEVLSRVARRSREEVRAALDAASLEKACGGSGAALPVRFGDLYRAQAFLWAGAGVSAGERLGRAVPGLMTNVPGLPSGRAQVLGAVASDLWIGYAVLRERSR